MVVPTLIKRLAEVVRVASARRRSSLPEGKVVIALDGRLVFFLRLTVRANTTAHELSIKGTHGEPLSTWSERWNSWWKGLRSRSAQNCAAKILRSSLFRTDQPVRRCEASSLCLRPLEP